ncbi:MAG: primosomal protein N' [Proteobacteria bacterium]|nr:primosomal protein N' [Pseudomonadota bacterium]
MQQYQLDISMPIALEQSFTYLATECIPRGCRVSVPFGGKNRRAVGVVLGPATHIRSDGIQLKSVLERLDDLPIYSPILMDLAQWMSIYYMHPLGEVLRAMLPASRVKKKTSKIRLTENGAVILLGKDHQFGPCFRMIWKKSRACSLKLFRERLKDANEKYQQKLSLAKLQRDGLVIKEDLNETGIRKARTQNSNFLLENPEHAELAQQLTQEQQTVLSRLTHEGLGHVQAKPFLLHGVTGAGKTEVYLHLIAEVLASDQNAQVLVMVPEIALTPQMTRIFMARFPAQVAVVHSAMLDAERWAQIESIRLAQKRILIGPRSSVFAPFAKLSLIIVDEEHDSSYKQANGLSYNGRDVAVMRGYLEKALVVLGSATPSLESYANAQQGKYNLLELPNRVHGRGLPEVELIQAELGQVFARKLGPRSRMPNLVELPIDARIMDALRENHAQGMQAMVIVNRRGFAYFLFSLRERRAVGCPNCSISMTVHKHSTVLRCHYCDFSQNLEDIASPEERDAFVMVGYGSEQMELYLRQAVPGARIQRVDADAVSHRQSLPAILNDFRTGHIDILVGTQMLAKGHDFARVTLICILEVDQVLNLPDFRAGERAFQLMVQAAGRAGRGEFPGKGKFACAPDPWAGNSTHRNDPWSPAPHCTPHEC